MEMRRIQVALVKGCRKADRIEVVLVPVFSVERLVIWRVAVAVVEVQRMNGWIAFVLSVVQLGKLVECVGVVPLLVVTDAILA